MSQRSEAYLNGWAAHANHIPFEENPYKNHHQIYSRDQWQSGWVARFNAIKHDLDTTLDDEIGV